MLTDNQMQTLAAGLRAETDAVVDAAVAGRDDHMPADHFFRSNESC